MTDKLHSQEIASWASSLYFTNPSTYNWLVKEWGKAKGEQLAAEQAFIEYAGEVPEWAVYIEKFEVVNGSYLFIHRDPDEQHQ